MQYLKLPASKWFSSYPDIFAFSLTMLLAGTFSIDQLGYQLIVFFFLNSNPNHWCSRINSFYYNFHWRQYTGHYILCHCWHV